jgi:hypothetical protein
VLREEGMVLAEHRVIVRDQLPLVKTDLTVDVVGCAPTIIRYVEDDARMWVPRVSRAMMPRHRLPGENQLGTQCRFLLGELQLLPGHNHSEDTLQTSSSTTDAAQRH